MRRRSLPDSVYALQSCSRYGLDAVLQSVNCSLPTLRILVITHAHGP